MKQIQIGENLLTVTEAYPYRYEYGEGKEVLRLKIEREAHGYTDIEAILEYPSGDIVYLEDGQEVNVYKGYYRDFRCSYQEGLYEIEIARISSLELEVKTLKEQMLLLLTKVGG